MAKDKTEKTNVMRLLEQKKLPYTPHDYLASGAVSGVEVAAALGEPPERVFKTLVTTGASGGHYVFVIPVAEELDLKKAAKAVGEKSIAMLPQKELLPLTGYIHGGCSPIGMKKPFPPALHESAAGRDSRSWSKRCLRSTGSWNTTGRGACCRRFATVGSGGRLPTARGQSPRFRTRRFTPDSRPAPTGAERRRATRVC